MKYVPKYLLPKIAPVSGNDGGHEGAKTKDFVPFKKESARGKGRGRGRGRGRGNSGRGGKKSDPLKKFGR